MPELNGIETVRAIRKKDKEATVYIMTGYHECFNNELRQLEKEGMDFELLLKPLSSIQIIEVVEASVGRPAKE